MADLSVLIMCFVVGVHDGDTLTCLSDEKTQIKVRLAEIDAPELHQAFGRRSKEALSDLCFHQKALVRPDVKDRYGRTVAHVECQGKAVNAEQVKAGMAWVYDQYVKDRNLYPLQDVARSEKRGLWGDSASMPPWEYRHRK